MAAYCHKCKAKLQGGSQFCAKCGAVVPAPASPSTGQRPRRRLFISFFALIAVAAAILIVIVVNHEPARESQQQQEVPSSRSSTAQPRGAKPSPYPAESASTTPDEPPLPDLLENKPPANTNSGAAADQGEDISKALDIWAKAYESNDPATIANCYADEVSRYFLRQDVTRSFINDYWITWFQAHQDRVLSFKYLNLTYESTAPDAVTLRLLKQVVTSGAGGATERLTRSELSLAKAGGQWKITSERDFK